MANKKRLAILLFHLFLLALITPASQVAAQSCVQPPDGLVSWWKAEGNANDDKDARGHFRARHIDGLREKIHSSNRGRGIIARLGREKTIRANTQA